MATLTPAQLQAMAKVYGRQYAVPPSLLVGLVRVEDPTLDTTAEHVNHNGTIDRGLAQINSGAFPAVSDAQAFNPHFALPFAASLLSGYRQRYGSWTKALEAYNAGHPTPSDASYAASVLNQAMAARSASGAAAKRTAAVAAAAGPALPLETLALQGPAGAGGLGVMRWALLAAAAAIAGVALVRIL